MHVTGFSYESYCASWPDCPCSTSEVAEHEKKTRGYLKTNKRWVQDLPVGRSSDMTLLLC
jgi:hypothetical protein